MLTTCRRLGQSNSLTGLRIRCYEVPCDEVQSSSYGLGYLKGIPVLMWLQETKFPQVKPLLRVVALTVVWFPLARAKSLGSDCAGLSFLWEIEALKTEFTEL